ncbi:hypothetical protein DPMN_116578 [Dreissena polymorpha]|uniref:Alpha-macroglobulin-like TED domain-containing protein n=1 Tax=Dreissena polymorpha TaxID=45954 RepID=A0A9D4KQ35_DREPO|nr:hypothetical protein DPMN_116578 [Dreissena polymorpha]
MLYWRASVEAPSSGSGPPRRAQARDIETTSYVLLIYATHQDVVVSLKIVKWLVEQRSPSGGFGSTQVRECFFFFIFAFHK